MGANPHRRQSHRMKHWISDALDGYADWYEPRRGTILGNVAWGIVWGLFLAACFTVIAAVPALIRALIGPAYAWQKKLTFLAIIGVYLSSGIAGGAVVGLLRPLSRWWMGRRLIGVVVAVPITIAIRYAVYGWQPWSAPELEKWTFTAVIWGLAMSFAPEPYVREYWEARDNPVHGHKHAVAGPRRRRVQQSDAGDAPAP
jgi:hypothetical protein